MCTHRAPDKWMRGEIVSKKENYNRAYYYPELDIDQGFIVT